MSSNSNPNNVLPYKTSQKLEACVKRTFSALAHENTAMATTPATAVQRVLKVYRNLKPVLAFLSSFKFLPLSVHTAIKLLVGALDALSESEAEIVARFKAGKDLEPAA